MRKRVGGNPDDPPHFVIMVKWRDLVMSESAHIQRLVDALDLPGTLLVFTAGNNLRGIAKRVKQVAGEPFYRKGW